MIVVRDRRVIVKLLAKEAKGGFVVIHANNVESVVTKLGAIPVGDAYAVVKLPRDFGKTYYVLYTIFELGHNQRLRVSVYNKDMEKVGDFEYWPKVEVEVS